jgi:hypothetical protein
LSVLGRAVVLGVDAAQTSGAAILACTDGVTPSPIWIESVSVQSRAVEEIIARAQDVALIMELPLYLATETWTGGTRIKLQALLSMAGARDVWRRTFHVMARERCAALGVKRVTNRTPVSWAPSRRLLAKLQSWRAQILPLKSLVGEGTTKKGQPRRRTPNTEEWKTEAIRFVSHMFPGREYDDDEAEATCIALWALQDIAAASR